MNTQFSGGQLVHVALPDFTYPNINDEWLRKSFNKIAVAISKILQEADNNGFTDMCIPILSSVEMVFGKNGTKCLNKTRKLMNSINKAIFRAITLFLDTNTLMRVVVYCKDDEISTSTDKPIVNVGVPVSKNNSLPPLARNLEFWMNAHQKVKQKIESGEAKIVLLGDSILNHLKFATHSQRKKWKDGSILNGAIKGDRVENVLHRIRNITWHESVQKIYLAVGTNNLLPNTVSEIVSTIIRCVKVLTRKSKAKVFVQSILPRLFVDQKIKDKITETNEILYNTLGKQFVDPAKLMLSQNGSVQRSLYWKDGLHLNNRGSANLAKFITDTLLGDHETDVSSLPYKEVLEEIVPLSMRDMCVKVRVNEIPVQALIDTGSQITLVNKAVADRIKGAKIRIPVLSEIRGIGNMPIETSGAMELSLQIGNQTHQVLCHVLDKLSFQMVLGTDVLGRVMSDIDFKNGTIKLVNKNSNNDTINIDKPCILDKSHVIQPHTVVELGIIAEGFVEGNTKIISGNKDLLKRGIKVPEYNVSPGSRMSCVVHNVSDKCVKLARNSIIGYLTASLPKTAYALCVSDDENDLENHKNALSKEIISTEEVVNIIDNLHIGDKSKEERSEDIRDMLREYASVFATDNSVHTSIPGFEHTIEVTDETPIRQKAYRADVKSQEIIDETVDKLLSDGIIEPSLSEWSSPVILVKKKGGDFRMCVDYRRLNKVMRKEEWPIPLIQDIFDSFGGARYFSVLDLKSSFFQIKMAENAKKYTAFICKKGLYQYLYMPFGLRSNPKAISRFMHTAFSD